MKFLVDRCAGTRLAQWLREAGHDVVEAREREPDPGDEELLAWSLTEQRILVTLDKDFGALIFIQGAKHAGLVRLPDVPANARIAMFERLFAAHANDLANGALITVRGDRIRISG